MTTNVAKELITPGGRSADNPSQFVMLANNRKPLNIADESTILQSIGSGFLSSTPEGNRLMQTRDRLTYYDEKELVIGLGKARAKQKKESKRMPTKAKTADDAPGAPGGQPAEDISKDKANYDGHRREEVDKASPHNYPRGGDPHSTHARESSPALDGRVTEQTTHSTDALQDGSSAGPTVLGVDATDTLPAGSTTDDNMSKSGEHAMRPKGEQDEEANQHKESNPIGAPKVPASITIQELGTTGDTSREQSPP